MTRGRNWSHSRSSSHRFFSGSKLSFQCEILSRNHIMEIEAHSGTRPAHVPVSARVVLFFFGFLLSFCGLSTLLGFVRVQVRSETLSYKHGTKFCFSFRIKLDLVSYKQTPLSSDTMLIFSLSSAKYYLYLIYDWFAIGHIYHPGGKQLLIFFFSFLNQKYCKWNIKCIFFMIG